MQYFLFLFNLLVWANFCLPVFGLEFETDRMKDTYTLLPANVQAAIEGCTSDGHFRIQSDNIIMNSSVKVYFNTKNQICHIGFNLFDDSLIRNGYIDACYFVENSLLNYVLYGRQPSIVAKVAKERETSFLFNNKPVLFDAKNMYLFSEIVKTKKISLNFNNYQFIANSTLSEGGRLTMKFPVDINLLKGKDKEQLEQDLILKMKIFAASNNIIQEKQDFRNARKISKGLYIQRGTNFETDDFRSDIYLTKKNSEEYLPVYSAEFPVESFSNLFICNLQSTVDLDLKWMLYGNKAEKMLLKLSRLQAFMSQECETFFGLQSNDDTRIKATIIYFNPVYRYIHMLVVEAEPSAFLIGGKEKTINASLYMFIPQTNFIKEVIYE